MGASTKCFLRCSETERGGFEERFFPGGKQGHLRRLANSPLLEMMRKEEWDGIALLLTEILHRPISKGKIFEYLKAE